LVEISINSYGYYIYNMQRFRKGRCSEVITAKILPVQRDFLEAQALAQDVSLCTVIREIINREMARARVEV
jgi:hypothetical protein